MKKKLLSENGATAVEYALIIALIAIVSMTTLKYLGVEIKNKFESMIDVLNNIDTQSTPATNS